MSWYAAHIVMDADEQDICNYLKQWPKQYIAGREVSRRAAGKHRFREDPYWASQPLNRLLERSIIETDGCGHFRLVQKEEKQPKKWIAPHIKKLLEESGKQFDGILEVDTGEDSES